MARSSFYSENGNYVELVEVGAIVADAEAARDAAIAAKVAAETAETNAETAETNAETAETNAETAQAAAEAARDAAEAARDAAIVAKTAAETAETNAETAETNAEAAETNAEAAAAAALAAQAAAETAQDGAEAALDDFDDIYLGAKASDPTLDNDGDPLVSGQLYWNTTSSSLRVRDGSSWVSYSPNAGGDLLSTNNLSDVASAAAARTNLGLAIGTNVQAFSAKLADVAGLAVTDGGFIVGNGTNFVLEAGDTARASLGLGTADTPTFGSLRPTTSDGGALGSTTLMWSDLFLASGGVINWNNGDVTLTHSAGLLTLAGAFTLSGGAITGTAKGHQLGAASGTAATGAVTTADANILLYGSSNNWAGIGTDGSGHVWIRTGTSGTPVPRVYFSASGPTVFQDTTAATAYNAASVTLAGGLGVAGAIIGNAAVQAAAASGFYLGAGQALYQTGTGIYNIMKDPSNNGAFLAGSTTDPANYFRNTTTYFQKRDATTYSIFNENYGYLAGEFRVDGDTSGQAGCNTITGTSDVTANSSGVGTIKFKGTTSRDSSGFIKIYIGTTAYYVPVFSAITG